MHHGQERGKVRIQNDQIELDVTDPQKSELQVLLDNIKKQGVTEFGDLVLEKPIAIAPDYLFVEFAKQAFALGYEFVD